MDTIALFVERDPEEAEAASVYVDGHLDGKPYRFLLDTGAARSSVVFDEYTATLRSAGKNSSSTVFSVSEDDLVTVGRLDIGPIVRQDLILTRQTEGPGRQSLIGMDVLRDFCCHFLFDDGQLLVDETCPPDFLRPTHPLLVDAKYHPYIEVRLGTASASSVWDTGASLTVVNTDFIGRHPDYFAPVGTSKGMDATGQEVETPMFVMSSAHIGGYLFPPHRVAAVDLSGVNATLEMPMDAILGYSTFGRADWLFDFPGKRWMISRW
ncbi:MAG: aspartyl protease family protein [Chloroflexi bacterium]|nr:aspartyl protease family protein [Chloroflexota bacterium]